MPLEYTVTLRSGEPTEVHLEGVPANPHDCLLLQKVSGLDSAPIDNQVDPWPAGDGSSFGPVSSRGRVISAEGMIVAPSRGRLRETERALRRACQASTRTWRLLIDGRVGDPRLASYVRTSEPLVSADEGDTTQGWGKQWRVAFHSPEPWLHAATAGQVTATPPPGGAGGIVFPLVFPLVFTGPASTPSGVTAIQGGDAPAWPTITLNGELLNPVVWNVTTGERIALRTMIYDGEAVTIDMRTRAVRSNGTGGVNRYQTVDRAISTWWRLTPGENLIRLIADGAGPQGAATVTWNDAYL